MTIAAPGDSYLVDLGKIVRVVAVSPLDAFAMARTAVFGPAVKIPVDHPAVYQVDQNGEIVTVVYA